MADSKEMHWRAQAQLAAVRSDILASRTPDELRSRVRTANILLRQFEHVHKRLRGESRTWDRLAGDGKSWIASRLNGGMGSSAVPESVIQQMLALPSQNPPPTSLAPRNLPLTPSSVLSVASAAAAAGDVQCRKPTGLSPLPSAATAATRAARAPSASVHPIGRQRSARRVRTTNPRSRRQLCTDNARYMSPHMEEYITTLAAVQRVGANVGVAPRQAPR